MRRNVIGRLTFAFGIAVASGCSLFVSLDGLQGSTADDGGSIDASFDAFVSDSASTTDANIVIDGAVSDAGRPSPCDGGHTICDDFDKPGEVPGDLTIWTGVDNEAKPGSNTITGDFFQSSPHAYAAFYGADAAAYNDEGIYRGLHGDFSSAHCEVDIRVEALSLASSQIQSLTTSSSCDDGEYIYSVWDLWQNGTQNIAIYNAPPDGGAQLAGGSDPFSAFQLHRWYHVAYDFNVPAGRPGNVAIAIDGNPVASAALPIANPGPHDFAIEIGALSTDPGNGDNRILFDNFACDVQ